MKILVLTDKYFPKPLANAVCAQELIRVWNNCGHTVDVLAYDNYDETPREWEGNRVFYVKPDLRLRLFYFADAYKNTKKGKRANFFANVLSKVKGALLLPWQPFYSFSFPNRIYKKLCELTTENDYDAIVAILNPIDSCIAANRFKKKNKNIPYVVFSVDTLKKAFLQKYVSTKFADGSFWVKRILKCCDAYFYMQSRREEYAYKKYDKYRDKLVETDLPRFKIKDCSKISPYDFGEPAEHWVYAGSIGGVHYNSDGLINIFKKISNNRKRILHMYVRGEEARRIADIAQKENLNIKVHGYVDFATLERVMASADVIVSLKTSDQVSAKIFECMSYGKPIVHFSGHKEDPNVGYLEKYPLCKVVKTYSNDIRGEILALENFLKTISKGTCIDVTDLKIIFYKSTPEHSAKEILEKVITCKARQNFD